MIYFWRLKFISEEAPFSKLIFDGRAIFTIAAEAIHNSINKKIQRKAKSHISNQRGAYGVIKYNV